MDDKVTMQEVSDKQNEFYYMVLLNYNYFYYCLDPLTQIFAGYF